MLSNMPSLDGTAILEALPAGAILIDRGARIRFINSAAASLLGIEGDLPIGQSLADLPGDLRLDREDEHTGYLDLPERWDKIAGTYRCGDGRYVRLHTNFPHHRDGVLRILGCAYKRDAVAKSLEKWSAFQLENAAAEAGLAATAMRSFEEWDAHPQGQAVARLPLLSIDRTGDVLATGCLG